jgi:hypothetical protein
VYTIHLVCRVPDRKHAPSAAAEGGGAARSVGEPMGRVGALSAAAETPGQEVQDWMRYMQDLTNSSSQLSEENLQQVTFFKSILRNAKMSFSQCFETPLTYFIAKQQGFKTFLKPTTQDTLLFLQ